MTEFSTKTPCLLRERMASWWGVGEKGEGQGQGDSTADIKADRAANLEGLKWCKSFLMLLFFILQMSQKNKIK